MGAPGALRALRLVCGLVLMAFVAGHLANLALGVRSLATMEMARPWLMGPWRTTPGITLLAGAALIHLFLGLYALGARRTAAMTKTDTVQLCLGLVTPPLLLNHAFVMHLAGEVSPGFEATFGQALAIYWSFSPHYAFQQLAVVLVVWMHAAIGLYSWLVLKPLWRRVGGLVLPVLFALPILALLGFAEAGKEALALLEGDAAWKARLLANIGKVVKVTAAYEALQKQLLIAYGLLVLLAAAFFAGRILHARSRRYTVRYDGDLKAEARYGLTVLEYSLLNDVPHAHVCSGRGRCGTCRVRVTAGADQLTPAEDDERSTLARHGAGSDERLACQARVRGPGVEVIRVLPAYVDASAARSPEDWSPAPEAPAR